MSGTPTKKKNPGHRKAQSSGQFYFVQHDPGITASVRDIHDDVDTIELNPKRNSGNIKGGEDDVYQPKAVNRNLVKEVSLLKNISTRDGHITNSIRKMQQAQSKKKPDTNLLSKAIFAIFGDPSKRTKINDDDVKKINQKLFLGNERTFLKWMNVSVWVTGAAVGLSAMTPTSTTTTNVGMYGDNFQAYSSLMFLGISIVICTYALVQFAKRTYLIVKRSPSGYEDRYGPVVIGSIFVFAFTAQYCIMMAQFTR